jgi:hypothetical protein
MILDELRRLPWQDVVLKGKAAAALGRKAARSGTAYVREARKRLPPRMRSPVNDNHVSP